MSLDIREHSSILSASVETISRSVAPELVSAHRVRSKGRTLVVAALALIVMLGFGFRAIHPGQEGLSEDELNKLRAVEDYRAHGLTAANGEHPMLMKALLTASIVLTEEWNESSFAAAHQSAHLSTETALRLPGIILGAFTSLLIFLVVSELFGTEIALIAAALWALDPTGISFNRIAKEDSFFLFFFLLANVFWLRGQRIAERGRFNPQPYYWATAAAFGAMVASKYLPYFIAVSASYYYIFQAIPRTRWRLGKKRWAIFFAIMGAVFILCNPAILLPGTWYEMKVFAGEHRIGHDSYEFMGTLFHNQVTLWLKGVPWYFYFVFTGVKLPLPVLAAFLTGLPLLFRKRLGDGRYFILFWLFYWFFPFSVMGGKFTRYYTLALPVVLITAAVGIHYISQLVLRLIARLSDNDKTWTYARACVPTLFLLFPAIASANVSPHYRLYLNALGGGETRAGTLFPHDEFYDAGMRDTVSAIARLARPGARVASEAPALFNYYAQLAGRSDLVSLSLSEREEMRDFTEGDFIIVARGRRYFSNEALLNKLQETSAPAATVSLADVHAVGVYMLDGKSREAVHEIVK